MLYARAQYALAPTLLSRSADGESLTLANFSNADALRRLIDSGKYTVVARAGPTGALLRLK